MPCAISVVPNAADHNDQGTRRSLRAPARHPFVTVDTEFLRESTYYPKLCVAQMASTDEAVVVDALRRRHRPRAVLHADGGREGASRSSTPRARTSRSAGTRPASFRHPLFDTQVAAMVLGYGDSISYDQLVQRITGDSLDKSHRFTDWTRRPLSDAQLTYAISDVTHLRDVYVKLAADLDKRGRTEWMREEMKVLTSPDTYRMEPEHAWQRLQDARAQAQGARRADGGRGLARARGADPRRAARARAQGRRGRRHRGAGADHDRAARQPALAAEGLRALEMGRGDRRGGQARARARLRRRCRSSSAPSERPTARRPSNCSRCCCA